MITFSVEGQFGGDPVEVLGLCLFEENLRLMEAGFPLRVSPEKVRLTGEEVAMTLGGPSDSLFAQFDRCTLPMFQFLQLLSGQAVILYFNPMPGALRRIAFLVQCEDRADFEARSHSWGLDLSNAIIVDNTTQVKAEDSQLPIVNNAGGPFAFLKRFFWSMMVLVADRPQGEAVGHAQSEMELAIEEGQERWEQLTQLVTCLKAGDRKQAVKLFWALYKWPKELVIQSVDEVLSAMNVESHLEFFRGFEQEANGEGHEHPESVSER